MERLLRNPVPAQLAVDERVVRLKAIEQILANLQSQVIPTQIHMCESGVLLEHFAKVHLKGKQHYKTYVTTLTCLVPSCAVVWMYNAFSVVHGTVLS